MSNKINYSDLWIFKEPQSVFLHLHVVFINPHTKQEVVVNILNEYWPTRIHSNVFPSFKSILERLNIWYLYDVFV